MNDTNASQREVNGECPGREVLADLVLGKLPMETIDKLGRHIEACLACQIILESLDGLEDSVVADLKGHNEPLPPDPRLQEQIRDAEQISRIVWCESRSDTPEEPPPKHLGQYEIVERIGQGGMGTVYKAMHTRLKRPVALKVLPQDRLRDPQAVTRFQREMEAVGRLDHPHLVRAHDAGEAEGLHYLVMEFLDGTDLARLVRRSGPLSVANACEAIRQAALGLQYAHEHGLIHRDVKPSNLMLTGDGTVKLLDLGLARVTDEIAGAGEMTSTGQIVGTGDFIAPEQGQDTRQADARSDIYALGCTLYFLLTGRAPFSGPQCDTFIRKVMAHANEPLPPIPAVRGDVPSAVVAIIERMTAKEPDQRFQSAADVAEALAPHVQGGDLSAAATGGGAISLMHGSSRRAQNKRLLFTALLVIIPTVICGGWYVTLEVSQPKAIDERITPLPNDAPIRRSEAEGESQRVADEVQHDAKQLIEDFDGVRRSMVADFQEDKGKAGKEDGRAHERSAATASPLYPPPITQRGAR